MGTGVLIYTWARMDKLALTFGCLVAILVLAEARPPKNMFGYVCNGNSTCEEGARMCGQRMKEAFQNKAKRERNDQKENMKICIEQVDIEFPDDPEFYKSRQFWKSIDENKMKQLKKCIMEKNGFIDRSGRIDRGSILSDIRGSFSDDRNLLSSMVSAIDTCPEPEELKMWDFFKCLGSTCIKSIAI